MYLYVIISWSILRSPPCHCTALVRHWYILCTGIVTLAEVLDYESCSQYHLVVAVHAAAGRHLLSTSQLVIDVVNANDHAPQFSHDQYRVFLSEDCHIGSVVIQLVATDADSCHGNLSSCRFRHM